MVTFSLLIGVSVCPKCCKDSWSSEERYEIDNYGIVSVFLLKVFHHIMTFH